MEELQMDWQPDESQREVIDVQGGQHLVLAPPGCGKTQILTERVKRAHACGTAYEDMLCLTFTNRAARGMMERIRTHIVDNDVANMYIGNIHRFCSRFLFEHSVIPAESSVIDDDDAVSILARFLDEDEKQVAATYKRLHDYHEVIFFSHLMYQLNRRHPRTLRLHTDCINANDIAAMREICRVQQTTFTAETMMDIYEHADFYLDTSRMDGYDYGKMTILDSLLHKMKLAKQYERYKTDHKLVDFEDLLLLTYDTLTSNQRQNVRRYPWIQVDEVQDLNPLQLAIVDAITADGDATVVFLGDEQQAIFSFMGAKLDTLDVLRERCKGRIHHLTVNHRSPKYLLDVLNTYASRVLNINSDLLPTANNEATCDRGELKLLYSDTLDAEYRDVAAFTRQLHDNFTAETTAIIVNSNSDAELVSRALRDIDLPHFKVSGIDLFSTNEVKLLLAHLNVLTNEYNFMAWSRLIKGLKVVETNSAARNFVRSCQQNGLLPSDFLHYENSSYLADFVRTCTEKELVVFDTETTGLDVFADDIVQIAAVKMCEGRVIEGSEFKIFITTNREIPSHLGDIANPIIEELKHNRQYPHDEALQMFLDYVGDGILLGHNADYDYHILDWNLRRYCPQINLHERCPQYFDSLKLVHLLEPDLKQYKLKALLEIFHLQGENSHLADADVQATAHVVSYCYERARELLPIQQAFMDRERVKSCDERLRRNYRNLFLDAHSRLYAPCSATDRPPLVTELIRFYDALLADGLIEKVDGIGYIETYLTEDVVDLLREKALIQQLNRHIMEINTLKEADLCSSSVIRDRVFVTTVHKAKGLEFDNVIVFDAIDGRYPNYYNQTNEQLLAEDARKFYVAMSRSRKRLYISQSLSRIDYHNLPHPNLLTRFMTPILSYFN